MASTGPTPLFELVVPCLNESLSLPELVSQTVKAAQLFSLSTSQFQLVIVNNGSTDNSQKVLEELRQSSFSQWFRVVELPTNRGYGGGIYAGLKSTTAPWVGFSHADLQCAPEDAFRALKIAMGLESEVQKRVLVQGRRKGRSLIDWITSRGYELAVGIFWGFWCFDLNAQPKVFQRQLIDQLRNPPMGIIFDAFVLKRAHIASFKRVAIPVLVKSRKHGESSWAKGFSQRWKTYRKVISDLRMNSIRVQ